MKHSKKEWDDLKDFVDINDFEFSKEYVEYVWKKYREYEERIVILEGLGYKEPSKERELAVKGKPKYHS